MTKDHRKLKILSVSLLLLSILIIMPSNIFGNPNLVSARKFAVTNGIAYQWFPIQKMLVMRQGLKSVKLRVDNSVAIVDGKRYPLSVAPKINDGQIMIPNTDVVRIFRGLPTLVKTSPQVNTKPKKVEIPTKLITKPPTLSTPTPVSPPPANPVMNPAINSNSSSVLVALRHSVRADHTRIVLEFNGNILYKAENSKNLFKLKISGCKNLIPTKRTNPVGNAIQKVSFNSGPNRKGLIISFAIPENKIKPSIETVGNPFRMIISFPSSNVKEVQTAPQIITKKPTNQVKKTPAVPMEKAPEINIEVPVASITNSNFLARTIVIDAGHGGNDYGVVVPGRPSEKSIVLDTAKMLKNSLEKIGMKAVLIRSSDSEVSQEQRRSIANRLGSDLFISLHAGGSSDTTKSGPACYTYQANATSEANALNYASILNEWKKTTRFDLAHFLAKKINTRLEKHLQVKSRGVTKLPLLPLKLIVTPAVLVEIGMLSDITEGKNLISKIYQKAVAQSIANGVVDFFNGIVIKQ